MFVRCQYLSFHTRSLRTSHVRSMHSMHMLHVTTGTVTVQEHVTGQDSRMASWQDGKLASDEASVSDARLPARTRSSLCAKRIMSLCYRGE